MPQMIEVNKDNVIKSLPQTKRIDETAYSKFFNKADHVLFEEQESSESSPAFYNEFVMKDGKPIALMTEKQNNISYLQVI